MIIKISWRSKKGKIYVLLLLIGNLEKKLLIDWLVIIIWCINWKFSDLKDSFEFI